MIGMKNEMTHLNAAQVFGYSFTHGTRYFKGHCIVWLFASCTCMDGVGAIMSNVCDTAEGEMIIQFNSDRGLWRNVSISDGGDNGDGVEEGAGEGPCHCALVLLAIPPILLKDY